MLSTLARGTVVVEAAAVISSGWLPRLLGGLGCCEGGSVDVSDGGTSMCKVRIAVVVGGG